MRVGDFRTAGYASALEEEKAKMEAEKHLRAALKADRRMAEAAYNLGVLLAEDRPDAGEIYLRQGKPERPSAVYLQALKKRPSPTPTGRGPEPS